MSLKSRILIKKSKNLAFVILVGLRCAGFKHVTILYLEHIINILNINQSLSWIV